MKEILYKAIVTEQKTKKRKIISFHACSLTEALHELRANGYSVNNATGLKNLKPLSYRRDGASTKLPIAWIICKGI